ncbi:hypothetical protein [Paraburkholderia sediminicola]|uniref:hypothetical protein n=1 Tax=Paraburkholderia sediminicola TaxID=458836 RepID=UPI0038B7EA32
MKRLPCPSVAGGAVAVESACACEQGYPGWSMQPEADLGMIAALAAPPEFYDFNQTDPPRE